MKGRMVLAAAPIGKLRVGGRSRQNAGFRRWKRSVSASSHSGLAAPDYDFALGIGDELVSYTVKKPRKSPTRYYTHSNSLFSIAATTNASGQVVEKYSYNAYGVQTFRNSANAVISKSAVGQDRGFTSYKIDSETGMYFARARMYSAKLGRFISRDFYDSEKSKIGYHDGFSLYNSYFIPNGLDPSGLCRVPDGFIEYNGPFNCKKNCWRKNCEGKWSMHEVDGTFFRILVWRCNPRNPLSWFLTGGWADSGRWELSDSFSSPCVAQCP